MIFKDKTTKAIEMMNKMIILLKEGVDECQVKKKEIKDQQDTLNVKMVNVRDDESRMQVFLDNITSK